MIILLSLNVLKDGGCASFPLDKNADVLFSTTLVGRSPWLFEGARDWMQQPIGFMVFTLKARVTAALTNTRRRSQHVDVM